MTLANEEKYEFDVSVVMPSYNSENFIRASVGSVINQTDVKVELIVVDDEGQDATREILEQLKADNPGLPMTLIYRPGGLGQSTARNAGIDAAKGKYIALLDSDDEFFATNTLADWVSYADRLNLDIACGQYMHVPLSGKARPARALVETGEKVVTTLTEPALVNATSCWQLLYNRSFLTRTNTRFSENLRQREDRLFVVQALLAADRIGSSAQFVVNHFDVPNSSFKQINRDQLEQFLQHVEELNDSFDQMRDAGRVGVEFETANCLIYFLQLINYWGGFVVSLIEANPTDTLVDRLFLEYTRLSKNAGVCYNDGTLNVQGVAEGLQCEGVVDVLKICMQESRRDLVLRILKGEQLTYPDFRSIASVEVRDDPIVLRYMSFTRDWESSTSPAPSSSKQLTDLVRRIIIHVGLPKTGSSSLQHTLEANRFRLIDQGILYPLCGAYREKRSRRERIPGHARFFNRILDGDLQVLPALCGEIEECGNEIHTVIFSSENILSLRFWQGGNGFRQIIDTLNFPNIEIVAVFRRQDEWIKSAFLEMHANALNDFRANIDTFEGALVEHGLLDFEACIETLEEPDSVVKLHAGSFENVRSAGGVLPWFCDQLKIDNSDWLPIASDLTNESLHPSHIALISFFKKIPAIQKPTLESMYKIITSTPPQDGLEEFLIPPEYINGFSRRHKEAISDYCKRAKIENAPPVREAKKSMDMAISKEMFEEFTNSLRPESNSIPMKTYAIFLSDDEVNRILDVANADKRMAIKKEPTEYQFRFDLRPSESVTSAELKLIGTDIVKWLDVQRGPSYQYVALSKELIDEVDLRLSNRLEVSVNTSARQFQRRVLVLGDQGENRRLLPPDWKSVHSSISTLFRDSPTKFD